MCMVVTALCMTHHDVHFVNGPHPCRGAWKRQVDVSVTLLAIATCTGGLCRKSHCCEDKHPAELGSLAPHPIKSLAHTNETTWSNDVRVGHRHKIQRSVGRKTAGDY